MFRAGRNERWITPILTAFYRVQAAARPCASCKQRASTAFSANCKASSAGLVVSLSPLNKCCCNFQSYCQPDFIARLIGREQSAGGSRFAPRTKRDVRNRTEFIRERFSFCSMAAEAIFCSCRYPSAVGLVSKDVSSYRREKSNA